LLVLELLDVFPEMMESWPTVSAARFDFKRWPATDRGELPKQEGYGNNSSIRKAGFSAWPSSQKR
jgi:hypothetical protein